ncbi:MAG: sulfotransferase family 2 domain-containing protein [Longimicrobiales bacterium]
MKAITRRIRHIRLGVHNRYLASCVFVHINKTAGSSIEDALGLPFQHRTAREFRDLLGSTRYAQRFSFAFVRNPWDKVASHYHYRRGTNRTGVASTGVDFNAWVGLAYGEQDPRYYDNPRMFMPQTQWIEDNDGALMVDYVGRFETLEADFQTVCQHLGRKAELPHLKKSERRDYRELYSAEARAVVERWFARDLEMFGYTFD